MNLRQYNRPIHVQAAAITKVLADGVMIVDNNGIECTIKAADLFARGTPEIGDWAVLWPASLHYPFGRTTWVSADDWAIDEWEPARGPVLS